MKGEIPSFYLNRINRRRALYNAALGSLVVGSIVSGRRGITFGERSRDYSTETTPEQAERILEKNPLIIIHRSANTQKGLERNQTLGISTVGDMDLQSGSDLSALHGKRLGPITIKTDPITLSLGTPPSALEIFSVEAGMKDPTQDPKSIDVAIEIRRDFNQREHYQPLKKALDGQRINPIFHSSNWPKLDELRRIMGDNSMFYYQLGEGAFSDFLKDPGRTGVWGTTKALLPIMPKAHNLGISVIGDIKSPQEAYDMMSSRARGFIAEYEVVKSIVTAANSRLT